MKRKRGRSVRKNKNTTAEPDEFVSAPHSFVIHKGITGGHIEELTRDFRKVMEPFTATSLKERKKNTIKDFVQIAGIFHVSHMCIFTRTDLGVYLKICRLPRGPSLTFKVHDFSLARDVVSSLKKQLVVDEAFKHSPLIVLNSFSGEGMQMKLMASMFQNMFPTINLTKVDLNTVRRTVMMNYNPTTKLIDFRHYAIRVAPVGISKAVKKVVQGRVPNLAKCENISEFLTKSGMLSESEAEDDPNSHVIVPQKLISRGNIESGKSAVRLSELGPRLSLQLIKIEDGLLDGEVLYHDLIHKTEEEKNAIRKRREAKKKLKERRKKIQDTNTKDKEVKKGELKEKSLKGMLKNKTDDELDETTKGVEEVEDDDAQYYREEVGEEPDQDLFSSRPNSMKRPPKTFHSFKNKRPRLDDKKDKKFDKFKKGGKFNKGHRDGGDRDAQPFRRDKKKFTGDKTNSQQRDFRPIGGGGGGGGRFKGGGGSSGRFKGGGRSGGDSGGRFKAGGSGGRFKEGVRKFNKSGGKRK